MNERRMEYEKGGKTKSREFHSWKHRFARYFARNRSIRISWYVCAILLKVRDDRPWRSAFWLNRFLFAPKQYTANYVIIVARTNSLAKNSINGISPSKNRRHTMPLTLKIHQKTLSSMAHRLIDSPSKMPFIPIATLTASTPTNSAECVCVECDALFAEFAVFFFSNGNDQTKIKRTICVVNCVSAANSSLSTICLHMFECVFASVHSRFASLIFHSVFGLILMCRIDVMLAYSNIIYLCVYSRLERNSVTECVHGSATNYVYIFHSRSLVTVPPTRQKRHKHTQAFAIRHIRQIAMNMLWKKKSKNKFALSIFRVFSYRSRTHTHNHTTAE